MSTGRSSLRVEGLKKWFPIRKGFRRKATGYVRAVDDVSFSIKKGETLGLVGESGCGKTTVGRCILRAIEPTDGEVYFNRRGEVINLTTLESKELRDVRRELRLIFQDPYSSLNPRMTVRDLIAEPLIVNNIARGSELDNRVAKLLNKVGLRPEYMQRYPHAFSGGQRQRIGIARALALNPSFVICDEPVSALDVSVQAQILNLLHELQVEFNLTYLFISHDLGVVQHISDRIAVMYVGRLVEIGDAERLFERPLHPYSASLLASAPIPDPKRRSRRKERRLRRSAGFKCATERMLFPSSVSLRTSDLPEVYPELRSFPSDNGHEHHVACHLAEELELQGLSI